MLPLDVREENLEELFKYLKEDKHCLGGAVAVPYKEKVYNLIKNNVKEEIRTIGCCELFLPTHSVWILVDGFTGTNTDGEAALDPIKKKLIESQNLNIGFWDMVVLGKRY